MHARPVADRFIEEAKRVRSFPSEREVVGAAWTLYPKNNDTDESKRSRLLRAYRASDQNFAEVIRLYESGANIGAIVAALDRATAGGAPRGNINARGKKKDFSLKRINNTWRAMNREEQDQFLQQNGLRRAP